MVGYEDDTSNGTRDKGLLKCDAGDILEKKVSGNRSNEPPSSKPGAKPPPIPPKPGKLKQPKGKLATDPTGAPKPIPTKGPDVNPAVLKPKANENVKQLQIDLAKVKIAEHTVIKAAFAEHIKNTTYHKYSDEYISWIAYYEKNGGKEKPEACPCCKRPASDFKTWHGAHVSVVDSDYQTWFGITPTCGSCNAKGKSSDKDKAAPAYPPFKMVTILNQSQNTMTGKIMIRPFEGVAKDAFTAIHSFALLPLTRTKPTGPKVLEIVGLNADSHIVTGTYTDEEAFLFTAISRLPAFAPDFRPSKEPHKPQLVYVESR